MQLRCDFYTVYPITGPYSGWKKADHEESDNRSPPYISDYVRSDREQYVLDAQKENFLIWRKYNMLVASTFHSLIERDTRVTSVIVFFQQHLPLSEDENESLSKAETLDQVHAAVMPHFSFCNFEVIESLNEFLELKENEQKFKDYVEAYNNFIITMYKNRVKIRPHSPGQNTVVLKLNLVYEHFEKIPKIPTNALTKTKGYIVSLLNKSCKPADRICASMLELQSIAVGCIELKFLASALVCECILQLSDKTRVQMFEMSITCIEVYTSTSEKVRESA